MMWRTFLGWLTLFLMFGVAAAVQAEEPKSPAGELQSDNLFPDRFMIRGGWNFVFDANTIFGINSDNGVSASADFENLLGGETQDNAWRIDSLYRFNQKHSVGFTYYDVDRTGNRVLLQDITIDNVTYSAGAKVLSELEIKLYRLFYNYSFYHNDKVELGLSGGMYVASIGVTLNANLTCTGGPSCTGGPLAVGGSSNTLTVPLPSFGFLINYNITPRLQAQGRLDWFYLQADVYQGSMSDFSIGLEYRLFKNFALGAAVNRLNVDINYTPEQDSGWQVENGWTSLYLYGALYF